MIDNEQWIPPEKCWSKSAFSESPTTVYHSDHLKGERRAAVLERLPIEAPYCSDVGRSKSITVWSPWSKRRGVWVQIEKDLLETLLIVSLLISKDRNMMLSEATCRDTFD